MAEPAGLFPPVLHQDPLRVALDCLTEGFQIIGPDWKYVYVNPAAARHGRRDADALIGQAMADAYPGIDGTPLFAVLRECMEQRVSREIENQFTFPDGSTHWFELRIRPVPAGICIYSADIEARKRPQPLAERIRRLFRPSLALALALVLSAVVGAQPALRYAVVPDWLVLPEGRTAIGSMHGRFTAAPADR